MVQEPGYLLGGLCGPEKKKFGAGVWEIIVYLQKGS
jgi:hypothetical protein